MGYLRCPVCKSELEEYADSLRCVKGHRYDRATQGYVNLTIGSKRRKSGDDKQMISARSLFLAQDHYLPLRDCLSDCLLSIPYDNALDLGCGEGYYTHALANTFPATSWTGIDLSVDAVKSAAKRNEKVRYLVASINDLPIRDASVALVLNIFAPLFKSEIRRVLKPGGHALFVLPGETHLLELKERLYPVVKLNPPPHSSMEGFETVFLKDLEFYFELTSNEELKALLTMTPYVHRTPQANIDRVLALDYLRIRASFRILCVKKPMNGDPQESFEMRLNDLD